MGVRVSYHSLDVLDMSICVVVVHHPLAHLIRSGPIVLAPKLGVHAPLAHKISSFCILNQSIDFTQKVLVLLKVEDFHYFGIHWLLELTPLVVANQLVPDMLDSIIDNVSSLFVED
jgi:hypothetical protein